MCENPTNSEEPDEMPHDAAFHQGLHCLLWQNRSSEKEAIITCDPSKDTMDHPALTVANFMRNTTGKQRIKTMSQALKSNVLLILFIRDRPDLRGYSLNARIQKGTGVRTLPRKSKVL